MSDAALAATLRRELATYPHGALCVGFSGGPDSSALLHVLAALPEARARGLRAIHVDHRLHPESRHWAGHCRVFCARLAVALDVRVVQVDARTGTGLEAAARTARYAAFAAGLGAGETLVTAHHRDDQAETVLLKLLRGAGPEGLGGMRVRRPFAGGWLWRPLLATPRAVLAAYTQEHGIDAILDPANEAPRHARSFLRNDILPRLSAHWPEASRAINHSARLSRTAADYLRQCSHDALATLQAVDDATLDTAGWLDLHPALRGPVLEAWLHRQRLPAPTLAQRDQLEHQARTAGADRVPLVRWPGAAVHVWRGRLHAHVPLPEVPSGWHASWRGEALALPAGGGMLQLVPAADPASVPTLAVRLGATGIRLRPAGDRHTRELRDLFQQAGIPPWRRRRCPLIYADDDGLLAVADLWATDAGRRLFDALDRHPQWQPAC